MQQRWRRRQQKKHVTECNRSENNTFWLVEAGLLSEWATAQTMKITAKLCYWFNFGRTSNFRKWKKKSCRRNKLKKRLLLAACIIKCNTMKQNEMMKFIESSIFSHHTHTHTHACINCPVPLFGYEIRYGKSAVSLIFRLQVLIVYRFDHSHSACMYSSRVAIEFARFSSYSRSGFGTNRTT